MTTTTSATTTELISSATNDDLAKQITNLLNSFEPEYIRPDYTSKKTAQRHADKLFTDLIAYAKECIENLGLEEFTTFTTATIFHINLPGSAPAGVQVNAPYVNSRRGPRPMNRYEFWPEATYYVSSHAFCLSSEAIERQNERARQEEIDAALLKEAKELSKTIPFYTFAFLHCTEEERNTIRANAAEFTALQARLAALTIETAQISKTADDRHYRSL